MSRGRSTGRSLRALRRRGIQSRQAVRVGLWRAAHVRSREREPAYRPPREGHVRCTAPRNRRSTRRWPQTILHVGNLLLPDDRGGAARGVSRGLRRRTRAIRVVLDRETARPRGFAFVEMEYLEANADAAIEGLNLQRLRRAHPARRQWRARAAESAPAPECWRFPERSVYPPACRRGLSTQVQGHRCVDRRRGRFRGRSDREQPQPTQGRSRRGRHPGPAMRPCAAHGAGHEFVDHQPHGPARCASSSPTCPSVTPKT